MTTFQKLIIFFLFIASISVIYYFFVFLPDRESAEQKRIEQIKTDCYKDLRAKLTLLEELAKAEGVPTTKTSLSPSEQDHVYELCLRQHGL